MRHIVYNNIEYELIENHKDAYNHEEIKDKVTNYFIPYDYIFGDVSYGKIRLKGFFDSKNKKAQELNNFDNLEKYKTEYCSFNCSYFLLKKKLK